MEKTNIKLVLQQDVNMFSDYVMHVYDAEDVKNTSIEDLTPILVLDPSDEEQTKKVSKYYVFDEFETDVVTEVKEGCLINILETLLPEYNIVSFKELTPNE
jgi:hypothetical protein